MNNLFQPKKVFMKKTFFITLVITTTLVQLSCKKDATCQVPAGQFTCKDWFNHNCSKSETAFFKDTCLKAGGVIKK